MRNRFHKQQHRWSPPLVNIAKVDSHRSRSNSVVTCLSFSFVFNQQLNKLFILFYYVSSSSSSRWIIGYSSDSYSNHGWVGVSSLRQFFIIFILLLLLFCCYFVKIKETCCCFFSFLVCRSAGHVLPNTHTHFIITLRHHRHTHAH